ncbi:MAG: chemotaxis protein CheA [Aquabacterium sp.]|uniref:chemotaxis protein CheA n=1 Tax=Aquabacterium sp. TaxID=1872578 RepID=UPI0025B92BB6|nr:chemotaxis protein CheA [Aquabacterium sp.]MBI5924082.1 chemotaxis protein CheA [Aquabacterium sp.]
MNDLDLDISGAVATFLVEGRELAQELEQGLLKLEQGHDRSDSELINAMFRAAHTIKGSAGIVGIDSLGRFTHRVESLLDRVREGEPLLDDDMITRLLRCCDHILKLLDLAEAGDLEGQAVCDKEAELLEGLGQDTRVRESAGAPGTYHELPGGDNCGFRLWAVFGRDCFRDGLDPASALHFLSSRCDVRQRVALIQSLPEFDQLDPETCFLAVALHASNRHCGLAYETFEFFRESSLIVSCSDGTSAAVVRDLLQPLRAQLGDAALQPWRDAGLIAQDEWQEPVGRMARPVAAVATQAERQDNGEPPSGTQASPRKAAASPSAGAAGGASNATRFVRVPAQRLDSLISQVGELVIAGAGVDVQAKQIGHVALQEAVGTLMQLIDTIQSSTLQMRMVPIGETFSRFQRVVRDVAHELGKNIKLDVVGAETELDKAMVERIGDPLMHLVRNAMDHGLETPQDRAASGKPEQGTLRLRAFHDSGNVVVEVSDDGRGLRRDKIIDKALAKGLISTAEGLSDHEAYQLIFEPGFSTAEQVTSLSGRGVGMDVVKKSVEALRGTITLNSREGEGTLVQMRLPLTLAIIDGFMVAAGDARFIVPLDMVVECIELPPDALSAGSPQYINLRGEVLPYVCLRQAFDIDGPAVRRPSVVVVRFSDMKIGLLVDGLLGEMQTVIKPMSGIFRHLRSVCGTSILGTGDIALILDVHQLVSSSLDKSTRQAVLLAPTPTV